MGDYGDGGKQGRRSDKYHDIGDSMPGTVGDSQGTFHDRASQDNNVIVDGEATNYESYKRRQQRESNSSSQSKNNNKLKKTKHQSSPKSSKSKPHGQLKEFEGQTIEVTIDRISNAGNPIARHQGIDVHVSGGIPGERYEVKLEAETSYLVGKIKITE